MASERDKDYHKLRNSQAYAELKRNDDDVYGYLNKKDAEALARFKSLWSMYGFKSMVGDKRRRNSTRKSNQKNKQILHQIERSRKKQNIRAHLINEDHQISNEPVKGKGYLNLY